MAKADQAIKLGSPRARLTSMTWRMMVGTTRLAAVRLKMDSRARSTWVQ